MVIVVKPLRDHIFEDIFYEIGANVNSVQSHKAKTAFFGTHKVDLITHLLFINALTFLCYDFTQQNGLEDLYYWIVLGVFTVVAILNNIHGHRIMHTTASSFNTKAYFVVRSVF